MKSLLKLFRKDEDGYVLVYSLILLPIFMGLGLLVIDVSRGNNAHSDLQAAADAVALAGARELDGTANAIANARVAMAELTNNVSMLALSGSGVEVELVYEDLAGNEFYVVFLRGIPGSTEAGTNNTISGDDNTPITPAFLTTYGTTDSSLAEYVYVRVQSRNLDTAFFNPVNLLPSSVPIAATAVAKSVSAVCNVTPMYICNPFESSALGAYTGPNLQAAFDAGSLHGRMIRLHPKGNGTHTPGNFGFLQVEGANGNTSASASALRSIFAGRNPGTCYEAGQVTTKPGAAVSIAAGINTKFDIFSGPFNNYPNGNWDYTVSPAVNVRKGYMPSIVGNANNPNFNDCNTTSTDDHFLESVQLSPPAWDGDDDIPTPSMGLPDNNVMQIVTTTQSGTAVPGAIVGFGDWPINTYLSKNYGIADWTNASLGLTNSQYHSFDGLTGTASATSPGARMPSRYDVYRWEIANGYHLQRSPITGTGNARIGGESGQPNCQGVPASSDPDPRLIYAAVIDCNDPASIAEGGGINTYNVNSYVEMFILRPMGSNGNGPNSVQTTYTGDDGSLITFNDATIDVEIVRVTGAGSEGVLENFVRNESILVR